MERKLNTSCLNDRFILIPRTLTEEKEKNKPLFSGQKILSEITYFAKISSAQHYLILCKEESRSIVPNSV